MAFIFSSPPLACMFLAINSSAVWEKENNVPQQQTAITTITT
jgi:hypothetical protein